MWHIVLVFIGSFIVDMLPFFGPPAWTVMVFLQMKFSLNVWAVLVAGVLGSTLGRYFLSKYIPYLSAKIINQHTITDIEFIGKKLGGKGMMIQFFVFLYTLVPLPSTPLFTAAGMAKIRALNILPAFFIGKFISDMVMVLSGDYVARNAISFSEGFWSWKSITGSAISIVIILLFLFIDWRSLFMHKKFRLKFNIWK